MTANEFLEQLPAASFVRECGSYQFAVEPFTDAVWEEFKPLAERHWNEMPWYGEGEEWIPDIAGRQLAIAEGRAVFCSIRKDGIPAGHCILQLFDSNLSGVKKATEDVLFIDPPHRVGRVFLRFVEYLHDVARLCGAKKLRIQACEGTRSARFFEPLGYKPLAQIMEVTL